MSLVPPIVDIKLPIYVDTDCKTVVYFRWLAGKGAKRRKCRKRGYSREPDISDLSSKDRAHSDMTNAKNTTVLESNVDITT